MTRENRNFLRRRVHPSLAEEIRRVQLKEEFKRGKIITSVEASKILGDKIKKFLDKNERDKERKILGL